MSLPAEITLPVYTNQDIKSSGKLYRLRSIDLVYAACCGRENDADKSAEGEREERAGGSIDRFIYARLGSNDRITSLCGKRAVARILNLNPRNVRAFRLNRPHNSSVDDFYRKVPMKIQGERETHRRF